MTDRERLHLIKEIQNAEPENGMFSVSKGAINEILDLLKEQEAKPVIVTTNAYGTKFYHCPRCNRDLYTYPRQLYCSNCGQAVKWNE